MKAVAAALSLVFMIAGTDVRAEASAPPANWPSMVDRYLEGRLKDPYSAVKKVTRGPRLGAVKRGFASSWYGWAVCYDINAKNSYGGFGGVKRYVFVITEEGVIGMLSEDAYPVDEISFECSMPADAPPTSSTSKPTTSL